MDCTIHFSTDNLWVVSSGTLLIGFLHTLLGPDHYVPFVAMARVGRWSVAKTVLITTLCGIGHVGSSIILGLIGVGVGAALMARIKVFEEFRGSLAGWMLLTFGATYTVWGIWRAIRNRPHAHLHVHEDGMVHSHTHVHISEHAHMHNASSGEPPVKGSLTPWVLFTVFVFGPCEPMIPLVMSAATKGGPRLVAWVSVLFALVTLATMLVVVLAMCRGVQLIQAPRLERYGHAIAGAVVFACGVAVKFGL